MKKKEEMKEKTEVVDERSAEEIAALTADLQRTRADFENFRKQVEIQKENEKIVYNFKY